MDEEEEWPEAWDRNKVYMYTDPTGIKVPVPIGFTVSGADSEKYVTGNVEVKGNLSNLTFTGAGDYPWTQNDDNIWVSGNKGVAESTSELVSNEITVGPNGGWVEIEWSVCSQSGYDVLYMYVNDTVNGTSEQLPKEITGTPYGTRENSLLYTKCGTELSQGKYTISIKYSKYNNTTHTGLDSGYVKSGTFINYDENGTDTLNIKKEGGLVIYEGTEPVTDENAWNESLNRNQFVWVPVADVNRICKINSVTGTRTSRLWFRNNYPIYMYETTAIGEPIILPSFDNIRNLCKYNIPEYSTDTFYKELEIEYQNTIKSIETYGGFYIGRYETGNTSSDNPIIKRLTTNQSVQLWYSMYNRLKNISLNKNIRTGMIWGNLWDETLQWMIDTKDKAKEEIVDDSTCWGNYQNSKFLFINTNGQKLLTNSGSASYIPTGSTERNKSNNIYDLAGNMREYTLEGVSTADKRILRGSYYYNSTGGGASSSMLRSSGEPNKKSAPGTSINNYGNIGFRAYMYIK